MPVESSISYEGVYYDYFFETGDKNEEVFSTSYSSAASPDPFSKQIEYYISVGLNSKYDGEGIRTFGRPPVKVLVLIDVSGSMNEPFDSTPDSIKSKLEVAKESLYSILDQLKPNDWFGLIKFDDEPTVIHQLCEWKGTDVVQLKTKISELRTSGGTALTVAIKEATDRLISVYDPKYQHRILNLTDGIPNTEERDSLLSTLKFGSEKKVYHTFVGMGVNFNTDLVEKITHFPASTYFSVESGAEFRRMMTDDFDYMMFPVAFDINIAVLSETYKIERVFGSPGNEVPKKSSTIEISSIFPSQKETPTTTKGGCVLIKLTKKEEASKKDDLTISLKLSFTDWEGNSRTCTQSVQLPLTENYSSTAVRKAILLTRYVHLTKHFLHDFHEQQRCCISMASGISPPIIIPKTDNEQKEHTKKNKNMFDREGYKKMFEAFNSHVQSELDHLKDEELVKLQEKLNKMMENADESKTDTESQE